MNKLSLIWKTKDLRSKILIVLGLLLLTRILAHIPIAGIDTAGLKAFFQQSQFFNLLDIFSGGGLTNFSIAMLGVGPYITASIIMQLATIIFPGVKNAYFEEGEAGRAKFINWSRLLTVPLAVLQSIGFLFLLQSQGVIASLGAVAFIANVALIAAGSMLLMWIGELVTEFGIGNGVSLIIFAGIVSRIPRDISQFAFSFDVSQIPAYVGFLAAALVIMAGVVFLHESERPRSVA